MSSIGSRIRDLRVKRGFTQDTMAEQLGMNRANFSNYERDVAVPPAETLLKIADILHTTTDFLLGRQEEVPNALDVARNDNEKDFLIMARHTEEIPEDVRENLKKFISSTIDAYLKNTKKQ
ncbi:helix-turn-helix domain-containing protein [Paenibacillus sp. HJGM_3]|uniref:helix-turn-helix domain-containing protein n=1 Tax=Paenibacillus sp. HJGM_3 TaxID=3379816 RepID=UPI0038597CA9